MSLPKGYGRSGQEKELGRAQALRCAKMAFCRAYGLKRSEQAVLLGTSERMIEKWYTTYREMIDHVSVFIRSVRPAIATEQPLEDIADAEAYTASVKQRLGRMVAVLDKALADHDIKVAMGAVVEINKVLGLSQTIKHKHEGEVVERKVFDVSPALAKLVSGLHERKQLPTAFREAEIVSDP